MGKQLNSNTNKARPSKKPKAEVIDVLEDDQFSLKEEGEQQAPSTKPTASMKQLMQDVMEVQADENAPFLSSFRKPLEKLEKDKQEKRELARTKKIAKSSSVEDKAFKFIANEKLEKQLRSLTMKGVAKMMNIIDSYRRNHPEE